MYFGYRMAQRNPEVVQSTSNLHDKVRETRFGVAKDILHDPAAFETSNDMFNPDAHPGEQAVQKAVGNSEFLASGLFPGLQRLHALRFIALKPSVFLECGTGWVVNLFAVSHFFIMGLPAIGLTQILNSLGVFVDQDHVFVGVRLFLPL